MEKLRQKEHPVKLRHRTSWKTALAFLFPVRRRELIIIIIKKADGVRQPFCLPRYISTKLMRKIPFKRLFLDAALQRIFLGKCGEINLLDLFAANTEDV